MLELLKKLNALKRMPRTGWSFCSIEPSEIEDVAQHSFEVASIALLLSKGMDVDMGRLVIMAIVHDWPEAVLGDFPYPTLPFLGGREVKRRMEDRAMQNLVGERTDIIEIWRECRRNESVEARLVHFADYFSILLQALHHAETGNRSRGLRELCENVYRDLEPYLQIFPQFKPLVEEVKRQLGF